MEANWNPDDIARTSDEMAVRQRYDQRNRRWLILLLIGFTWTGFIEVVSNSHSNTSLDVVIGSANFGIMAAALFAFWSKRTRPWMNQRIAGLAIGLTSAQYLFSLAFTRNGSNWIPIAMSLPLLVLGFRMLTSELALVHAIMTAGGIFMSIVAAPDASYRHFYIAVISVNGCVLALNLWLSRRLRRNVVGEWTRLRNQAREQIRMRDELRYARELQLSMLPDCAPHLDWLDICATSVPATEVGGDYYDYFVGDDHVAVVSGDVAGHGMSAGLVLAAVRAGFTILREKLHDPAFVLRRLHDLVSETSRRRMLVTVSVALIERDTRRVTIASAGHPPVLIRRASGQVETIDLWAAPLGVRLPVEIPQRTLDIAEGDALILHSDGIYETRNAAGEVYGLERLAEATSRGDGSSAPNLLTAILSDVQQFRGAVELEDDMTLVVVRVR